MQGNILLLQGPMGPFFRRLAHDLARAEGVTVYKINLNAGDWLFFRGPNAVNFTGDLTQWPDFLADRIRQWDIGRIYLFGDTRVYHTVARTVADSLSVPVGVFEEGYLRPYYITLEMGGVNRHSSLPADPAFYRAADAPPEPQPRAIAHSFSRAGWYATWYYILGWLGRKQFPHYRHHRPFNPYHEAFLWCRAGFRRYRYQLLQRKVQARLTTTWSGKFYLAPLQVHCDGQLRTCEHVASAAAFVRRVIGSFAHHAPAGTRLVLKHHPLDRGYSDYTRLIRKLTRRYGVEGRVYYVHDLHLPTLLEHAIGTIVVNSTVGLSSLLHGTPVKTLGHAVYNLPELTCQDKLDSFWRAPGRVDQRLNHQFRSYLAASSQLNGSFYSRPAGVQSATGLDIERLLQASGRRVLRPQPETEAQDIFGEIIWLSARTDRVHDSAAAMPVLHASYDEIPSVAMAVRNKLAE